VASTTNDGKRENDGDSGKEPEICDRVVADHPNADAAGSKARDCKAILPIYRLPVFEVCFEVVWKRITAPFELCSLVVFVGHDGESVRSERMREAASYEV
jgi:hypothetical protein